METLKPNELRVGNWVERDGEVYQITSVTILSLERGETTVNPIPITSEILLKLGFVHSLYIYRAFDKGQFSFDLVSFRFQFDNRFVSNNRYKYVHQLQNLYFALTNEELTIDL